MLLKNNRLSRLEVEQIKRSRQNPISGNYFGLVKLTKEGEPKFAVIISNKIAKSAVVRNQIRRTIYNTIYPVLAQQKGWHLFLAKKNVVEASKEQIIKDTVYLIDKIQNSNFETRKNN